MPWTQDHGLASMIAKEGSRYVLRSKDGSKVLGRFPTRAAAEKREQEIRRIKAAKAGRR